MKILVSSSHFGTLCQEAWELFEKNGLEVAFDPARPFPAYSTDELRALPDREQIAAVLIGMDDYRDEGKYQALPNLKAVAKFGVGVDNIDGALAKRYGVRALNAPGQNANAVSELTVGCILDLLRRVIPLHEDMKRGLWTRAVGSELKDKRVGLLGFGAVARLTAKKLRGFDAQVSAYDVAPDYEAAKSLGVQMRSQREIIEESDIVSIHIPASLENYHLFDANTIGSMKDGAYLINPARGALIDLDALARALLEGKLAGAALDAFETEPLPLDAPILRCRNVVLTPHTGAETEESYYKVSMTAARDIIRVLKGEEPENCVND